ncbi:murein biosynthesis integral membrane protein MurJ [Clostridium oryzae]|uniref:Lipid II flippase n=1 Tax=Clostridium oryzae TaxID=1450648 RepID=A0A1V4IY93_9CLOT|nr:murein biosynthesis integral membrane protein MurJ [Clostridium oryzae]OPJ65042.1 putative peptidoglycan biosynthesis protein MurJ [Clostridium oryzae]
MNKSRIARNSILISIILILSKAAGFLRELVIAVIYGATRESDIFKISTTIPTVIFSCIASTIVTTFIPVFATIKQDKKIANEFFSNILNIVSIAAILLSVISIIISPLLVTLFASGFTGKDFTVTVRLTRIALPSIIFLAIASLYTAYLQSYEIFLQPSLTDMAASLVIILGILAFRNEGVTAAVISVLAGAMIQIVVQRPFIKNFKYKPIVNFKDKYILQIITLGVPVFMSNIVGQFSVILNRTMVSRLEAGSISVIDYAAKISTIINQVFVVSVVTVLYPMLTEKFLKTDKTEFSNTVIKLIDMVFIISLPLISMLIVFGGPAVQILLMHGRFDSSAAAKTINCVKILAVGTVGYGILDTVSKVFFSARKTKIPMYNSFITAVVNISLILYLVPIFGVYGAALATAATGIIMATVILLELKYDMNFIRFSQCAFVFVKCALASVMIGVAANYVYFTVIKSLKYSENNYVIAFVILICVGLSAVIYIVTLRLMNVKEIDIINDVLQKLGKIIACR